MRPKAYLAGHIGHLDFESATGWRVEAAKQLAKYGIAGYSPMRSKDFLNTGAILPSRVNVSENPLATSRGIMCRDFHDCTTADALLVYFKGESRISLGTAMELAWAYDRHIPVVVVSEPDNPNVNHPMADQCVDYRVDTLEQAVALIATIINPGSEA